MTRTELWENMRRAGRQARAFAEQGTGSILTEAAFVFPIFLMLIMGSVEVSRFVLLDQKVSRLASNVADLTARAETLTADDVDQVFDAASHIMSPFDIDQEGLVYVSSVMLEEGETDPVVNWQRSGAGSASHSSQIGSAGGNATLPSAMDLREGEDVIVAESYYDYEPFFFSDVTGPRTIYHVAFYRPRFGALTELQATE